MLMRSHSSKIAESLVQHSVGLVGGVDQPRRHHVGHLGEGRRDQIGLRREVVVQAGARDLGQARDLTDGGLRVPDLRDAAHGRVDDATTCYVAAGAYRPPQQ